MSKIPNPGTKFFYGHLGNIQTTTSVTRGGVFLYCQSKGDFHEWHKDSRLIGSVWRKFKKV